MTRGTSRLQMTFDRLRDEGRAGFIPFLTAGDPDLECSERIIRSLPAAGADIIELGMPFSDPMADGPVIQKSSVRAIEAGMTIGKILDLVERFRTDNKTTPIVLMGYFNPIMAFGVQAFLDRAITVGVDGLIIVDLPPEEDADLCLLAVKAGLNFIRLVTPTTDDDRLSRILENAGGFLYYVAIAGVTGTASADPGRLKPRIDHIKNQTKLPVAVGFGVSTREQAAQMATFSDAVVVGSALVRLIEENIGAEHIEKSVLDFTSELADAVAGARTDESLSNTGQK